MLAGFAERDGDTVYNSAVFVDGARTQVYRKAFLYGDYEKRLFAAAAATACIVEHGGLKIGVLICYDVEFPENVRRLAEAGADLVAVPTALPASDHAAFISGSMIPVRAFENQVHLAYVNHCGADGNFAYAGLSRIAAPDGRTLAVADASPALLFADIEPAAFAAAREANPYLEDLARSAGRSPRKLIAASRSRHYAPCFSRKASAARSRKSSSAARSLA